MAILSSGTIKFEFQYSGKGHYWIYHSVRVTKNDSPLIADHVFKEYSDEYPDIILSDEFEIDSFIPFLKEVTDKNQADYWEPEEPKIIVALYPDMYFPFLKPHGEVIYESEQLKAQRESRQKLKKEKGKLPDDTFTMIIFFDEFNFNDVSLYSSQGISFHLIVTRIMLERFISDLEVELSTLLTESNR
jgi:hypothetical protein